MDLPAGEYHCKHTLEESGTDTLPLELRNYVYDILPEDSDPIPTAADDSKISSQVPEARLRRLRSVPYHGGRFPLLLLSLTHVCRQLRAEFRSLRLKSLTGLLRDVQVYVYSFIEKPKTYWVGAFQSFYQSVGIICIRISACGDIEILPLLRFKARHPACQIRSVFQPRYEKHAAACTLLVDNQNPQWLRWVVNGTMKQVRLIVDSPMVTVGCVLLHLVLRRLEMSKWTGFPRTPPVFVAQGHLIKLGLALPMLL